MDYKKNDLVRYSTIGICRIENIEKVKITEKPKQYYILKPVFDKDATIYVPIDSEVLLARMRPALSADEINDCFRLAKVKECPWIDIESERKATFKGIVSGGDFRKTVALLKTIRKREVELNGKPLHSVDKTIHDEATKLIAQEIAVAYNFESPDKGKEFIDQKIKPRAKKS